MVSEEDLEQLVAKRLKERKEIINEAVTALEPTLEGLRKEISAANHVKLPLGRQLTRVERLLRQTMAEVRAHADLPFHPAGSDTIETLTAEAQKGLELLEQFGVEDLSLEQKQALPEVLDEHVRNKQERAAGDRRASDRLNATHALSALMSAILTAIAMSGGLYVYLSTHPIGGR